MKRKLVFSNFDIYKYVNDTPFNPASPYNDTENMMMFYNFVEDLKDTENKSITEQANSIGIPGWLYSRWYGWSLEARRYHEAYSCYLSWITRHPEDQNLLEDIENENKVFDPVHPYYIPQNLGINADEIWEDLSGEFTREVVYKRVSEIRDILIKADICRMRQEEASLIFEIIDLENIVLNCESDTEWGIYNNPSDDLIIQYYEEKITECEQLCDYKHNKARHLCSLIGIELEDI